MKPNFLPRFESKSCHGGCLCKHLKDEILYTKLPIGVSFIFKQMKRYLSLQNYNSNYMYYKMNVYINV